MSRAIVTIACGDFYQRMSEITHPMFRAYADKVGADFIVWNDSEGHVMPHYKKIELGGMLDKYDRVLYLDTDILIRDDAPDIFAIVPEDELGMLDEGQYYSDRTACMTQFMQAIKCDPLAWDGKYYNAGVMVLSQSHKKIFVQPFVEVDNFREQTYLNVMISGTKTKVFPLPYRFNRVYCMDSVYGEERFDSYFLHYAGINALLSEDVQLELMRNDLGVWRLSRPAYNFRRNIAFVVQGDLARQIAAEPAIRYAREVVYAPDRIVIVCDRPQLFSHVSVAYLNMDQVPEAAKFRRLCTGPEGASAPAMSFSPDHVHPVDIAALDLLGIELPLASRTPKLRLDAAALTTVAEKVQPSTPGQLVLLHPGRSISGDTFPPDVWQTYADMLVDRGHRVAVFGNRSAADCPVVEFDTSRCLDLTDRLSLWEIIALISQSKVLIANDSAAIHIGGAFEPWIGLIAPSRHPERVLPWRRGSQYWKAANLERAARYSDRRAGSTPVESAQRAEARLRECLPSAETVLQFVERALADTSA
jgi:hypothetical protein